jgi:hypothetical protein
MFPRPLKRRLVDFEFRCGGQCVMHIINIGCLVFSNLMAFYRLYNWTPMPQIVIYGLPIGYCHHPFSFADLQRNVSVFSTIDDHEVINDFAGGAAVTTDPRFSETTGLINPTALYKLWCRTLCVTRSGKQQCNIIERKPQIVSQLIFSPQP